MATPYRNVHDSGAKLDYGFDWQDIFVDDTIQSTTWTVPTGLTKLSTQVTDGTQSIVWLSGGTAGQVYECVCHVVMASTREDERTLWISCKER